METEKQFPYQSIVVLVNFFPHAEKLLQEALYYRQKFQANLTIIIIEKKEEVRNVLHELIENLGVREHTSDIFWEKKQSIKRILEICRQQNIDLLINEVSIRQTIWYRYIQKLSSKNNNPNQTTVDSFSRQILKQAFFSVLMLPNLMSKAKIFQRIIVHLSEKSKSQSQYVIQKTFHWANAMKASKLYLMKEVNLIGLSMLLSTKTEETSEQQIPQKIINEEKEKVSRLLAPLEKYKLPVQIEIASGKIGVDLEQFTTQINANLLVVDLSDFKPSLISKVLNSQLEYILNNLPSRMLFVHSQD